MISLILLVFAIVLFAVAAALPPPYEPVRSRLGLAGLAFLAASELASRALPHT